MHIALGADTTGIGHMAGCHRIGFYAVDTVSRSMVLARSFEYGIVRARIYTSTHAFVVDIRLETELPGGRMPFPPSPPPSAGVEGAAWNV
jgi:hypothetical protein